MWLYLNIGEKMLEVLFRKPVIFVCYKFNLTLWTKLSSPYKHWKTTCVVQSEFLNFVNYANIFCRRSHVLCYNMVIIGFFIRRFGIDFFCHYLPSLHKSYFFVNIYVVIVNNISRYLVPELKNWVHFRFLWISFLNRCKFETTFRKADWDYLFCKLFSCFS